MAYRRSFLWVLGRTTPGKVRAGLTVRDYVEVGPLVLAQVEFMHIRTNHYPIMEHHSCLPQQSLFVSGFFLLSSAFF